MEPESKLTASSDENTSGPSAAAVLDDWPQDCHVLLAGLAVTTRDHACAATDDALLLHADNQPHALVLLQRQHSLASDANVIAVAATNTLGPALASADC